VIVCFVDVGKIVDHQMFKLSLYQVAQYHDKHVAGLTHLMGSQPDALQYELSYFKPFVKR
jgi:hypothetical protein